MRVLAGVDTLAYVTAPLMLRQLRHDIWATRALIERCASLTPAQLALAVPGTYGTILATLEHIVVGELRYLARLGAQVADAKYLEEHGIDLHQIAELHTRAADAVERLFTGVELDPDRAVIDAIRRRASDPPLEIETWVLLVQFAHHGSDHRAQIGTILGAHGLAAPDLDVWAYARATGAVREWHP